MTAQIAFSDVTRTPKTTLRVWIRRHGSLLPFVWSGSRFDLLALATGPGRLPSLWDDNGYEFWPDEIEFVEEMP